MSLDFLILNFKGGKAGGKSNISNETYYGHVIHHLKN